MQLDLFDFFVRYVFCVSDSNPSSFEDVYACLRTLYLLFDFYSTPFHIKDTTRVLSKHSTPFAFPRGACCLITSNTGRPPSKYFSKNRRRVTQTQFYWYLIPILFPNLFPLQPTINSIQLLHVLTMGIKDLQVPNVHCITLTNENVELSADYVAMFCNCAQIHILPFLR